MGGAPLKTLKKVLLPAPLGPIIAVSVSGVKLVDTSLMVLNLPKVLLTLRASRIGVVDVLFIIFYPD